MGLRTLEFLLPWLAVYTGHWPSSAENLAEDRWISSSISASSIVGSTGRFNSFTATCRLGKFNVVADCLLRSSAIADKPEATTSANSEDDPDVGVIASDGSITLYACPHCHPTLPYVFYVDVQLFIVHNDQTLHTEFKCNFNNLQWKRPLAYCSLFTMIRPCTRSLSVTSTTCSESAPWRITHASLARGQTCSEISECTYITVVMDG